MNNCCKIANGGIPFFNIPENDQDLFFQIIAEIRNLLVQSEDYTDDDTLVETKRNSFTTKQINDIYRRLKGKKQKKS